VPKAKLAQKVARYLKKRLTIPKFEIEHRHSPIERENLSCKVWAEKGKWLDITIINVNPTYNESNSQGRAALILQSQIAGIFLSKDEAQQLLDFLKKYLEDRQNEKKRGKAKINK